MDDENRTPVLNFVYEFSNEGMDMNLYERGGINYIVKNASGRVEHRGALPNEELGMLFPVAKIECLGECEKGFKKAIEAYVELH